MQLLFMEGSILRRLSFTITREFGTDGIVKVITGISYEQEPNEGYFPANITRTFTEGEKEVCVYMYTYI